MSTLIQAKLAKKRWLDWARESLHQGSQVEVSDAGSILEKLKQLKSSRSQSLSYEVSNVAIADASSAIVHGLSRLGIDLQICVVGAPLDPAVIQLTKKDLDLVLREGAQTEKTIALAPAALDGILVVDMPAIVAPSALLVSGCGSMEKLIAEIQLRFPGGSLFRGN